MPDTTNAPKPSTPPAVASAPPAPPPAAPAPTPDPPKPPKEPKPVAVAKQGNRPVSDALVKLPTSFAEVAEVGTAISRAEESDAPAEPATGTEVLPKEIRPDHATRVFALDQSHNLNRRGDRAVAGQVAPDVVEW